VLAAAYLLWLYQRTAFGTPNPEFMSHDDDHGHAGHGHAVHSLSAAANDDPDAIDGDDEHGHADIHDVTVVEWIAWTPFLVAIVVFGVYPQLMFKVMDPAVTQLVSHITGATAP
jgi:NADH-quinone oxidoreductase subunit M